MEEEDMEGSFRVKDRPDVSPLVEVSMETPKIKSLYVNSPEVASESEPGQFVMVWVIGEDEIPMAVSSAGEDGKVGITVEKVGDATAELHELEEGDLMGLRGPYGNGFDLSGEKLLVICGGCGTAPLIFAVEEAVKRNKDVTVVLTAKTAEDLPFRSEFEEMDVDLLIGTEDGSAGVEGLTTDALEEVDWDRGYDSALICGPERMMEASARFAEERGVPAQVSLNRYMKCGIGICGQCSLDDSGDRVCEEGPVFRFEDVKDGEFGKYRRDATGKKSEI